MSERSLANTSQQSKQLS